jgi:ferredoxin
MPDDLQLTIDGQAVTVPAGTTILDAARAAGIEIPVLCYFEHTTSNGLCRLCVVETEGARGLQAACVSVPRPGSVIHTRSENVERARRTILEMLAASVDLSEAPDLGRLLQSYGANSGRFDGAEERQPALLDDNPMYIRDYAKCVLCWRCVQVCAEDAQYLRHQLHRPRFLLPHRDFLRQAHAPDDMRVLRTVRRGLPDRRPEGKARVPVGARDRAGSDLRCDAPVGPRAAERDGRRGCCILIGLSPPPARTAASAARSTCTYGRTSSTAWLVGSTARSTGSTLRQDAG